MITPRSILLPCFLFLFALTSKSQDSTISLSRLEIFSTQPSRLIKTETQKIGSVLGVDIFRVKSTDIGSGDTVSAIKISFERGYRQSVIETKGIFIDRRQLDTVINTLNYFVTESNKPKTNESIRSSFFTVDGIEISYSYSSYSDYESFGFSRIYEKLRTPVPGSGYEFNKKRIQQLIAILSQVQKGVL